MKRNLFVILLAVMLVAAVVFAVTPDAKANSGLITVQEDGETITVSAENTVLNLNGKKNVVVKIENGAKLSVIDTSFMVDAETLDLTGNNAGTLTVDAESTGTIAPVAFDGDFRYLAVETEGTYSFHPFNLAISKLGINTIGEAVCIRVTFIANDVVKAMLEAEGGDYGIKSLAEEAAVYSAKEKYTFSGNGIQAYFDLKGSFDADKLDTTCKYQAYMTVNGVDVLSNYVLEITPREVLKTLNKSGLTPTDNQKAAIETLAANNAHLADLFTSVTGASCTHNAMADATCVKPSTCKNCDVHTVGDVDLICGHNDLSGDHFCDDCGGIEGVNIGGGHSTWAPLPGNSATWEISGTMVRPLGDIDGWNFGFAITSGDKKLTFSCVTDGIVFENSDGHGRYAYHGISGITRYNLNTDAARLFSVKNNTKDTMYFKAMIVDDVFYAWFGFSEDALTLTWYVPLTETLTGTEFTGNPDWTDRPFTGFAPGSEYGVEMHVNSTTGSGSIIDLDIKTDADVDTTKIPAFVTVPNKDTNVTIDNMAGTIHTVANNANSVTFAGAGKTWEISGTVDRMDAALTAEDLCMGFNIKSGSKSLRMSATRMGVVFESHDGHGRYAYHAFGTSQYNLSTNSQFFSFAEARTQSKMHFKAMIVDDTFYVWFWFDGEQPTLSWVIPLTETLQGVIGGTAWTDGLFTGFAAGSSYTVELFVNKTSTAGRFTNLTAKTGFEANGFIPNEIQNATVDISSGVINNISGGGNAEVSLYGASNAWEISGTADRMNAALTAEDFCMGFMIESGGKSLRMSATRMGLVFEAHNGHGRYAYHAFGTSHYNLNTKTQYFSFSEQRTQSKMHFKALIVDDVFYAYFWFDGEEPTLCWYVPLTEALTGVDGGAAWTDNPFTGFAAGSEYTVRLFVNGTSTAGQLTNLVVKNGESVDKTQVPEYVALISNGTVDANGDVSISANTGSSIKFAGNSATWEVSGAVERNGNDPLCMGLNIRSGGKSLRISATTRGPVFEAHSGHGRYAYHAIIDNGQTTQYVKSTLNLHKFASSKEESKMYYKAIIADDVLYVWFWFEGEEPVLAWEIPLTETLTGVTNVAWTDNPFTGFAAGSTYTVELFNNNSASTGKFSNITVVTGSDVDTSILPADEA